MVRNNNKIRLLKRGFPATGGPRHKGNGYRKGSPSQSISCLGPGAPTPSRAILGSLLPVRYGPGLVLRQLGIKIQGEHGEQWTLTGRSLREETDDDGKEWLLVNNVILRALEREQTEKQEFGDHSGAL